MPNNIKPQLRVILERHNGQSQAITGRELAQHFGFKDDRKIRLIIRELITEGLPVASRTDGNKGYFVITTRQEANEYAESIKNRLIQDALRRRDFRRAAALHLAPAKQGRLFPPLTIPPIRKEVE